MNFQGAIRWGDTSLPVTNTDSTQKKGAFLNKALDCDQCNCHSSLILPWDPCMTLNSSLVLSPVCQVGGLSILEQHLLSFGNSHVGFEVFLFLCSFLINNKNNNNKKHCPCYFLALLSEACLLDCHIQKTSSSGGAGKLLLPRTVCSP